VQLGEGKDTVTIVGVVGGVTRTELAETNRSASVYFPYAQRPLNGGRLFLAVRTRLPQASVHATVSTIGRSIDSSIVVYNDDELGHRMSSALAPRQLTMAVLAAFGALSVLVAALGLYAMMSYVVSQRRAEFGIRMALGSQRSEVLQLVLRDAAVVGLTGVALGLVLATLTTPSLRALLYGVSSHDITTFVVGSCVLALIVVVAGAVPAHRATQVDPALTMRGW
jgi:ABC-type antimicrobial peptide transport system permease subunit